MMSYAETKILIVEDDGLLASTFEMFIKQIGYTHFGTATSSADALKLCETMLPDIVLMDIHLEGEKTGIETAAFLGKEFNLPVVYITGDDSIETVRNAVLKNTYGFLSKPLRRNVLEASIEFALNKHRIDYE